MAKDKKKKKKKGKQEGEFNNFSQIMGQGKEKPKEANNFMVVPIGLSVSGPLGKNQKLIINFRAFFKKVNR